MEPLCHPAAERIVITCWSCKHTVTLPVTPELREMERWAFHKRLRCTACGTNWPHLTVEPREKSRWGM